MRLANRPRVRSSTRSRERGRSNNGRTSRRSSRDSRRIINASGTLPRVSNKTPRHARSSLKKLRVPTRHSLTPVTHRPLTHTKRAPQHRVRHMRRAAITKQRINKNRRLIIATARHVTSGSRYALTRSLHTVHKLTQERPHAPQRPGAAHAIDHHQQKPFPRPQYTAATFVPPLSREITIHAKCASRTRQLFTLQHNIRDTRVNTKTSRTRDKRRPRKLLLLHEQH